MTQHVYLKLGGALITEKGGRESLRPDVLDRLVDEIATFVGASPLRLVVSHGSGSYAHVAARESGFQDHPTPIATSLVAAAARRLNAHVVEALLRAGLPAMPLPAAAIARCTNGKLLDVRVSPLSSMLSAGLLPVVYGDAAPDSVLGGTIVSTEPLIGALAQHLPAARIVLATDVDGVFPTDPHLDPSARRYKELTAAADADLVTRLSGARPDASDVTGGMASKVERMMDLVRQHPDVVVRIVSGLRPGAVLAALADDQDAGGTVIRMG